MVQGVCIVGAFIIATQAVAHLVDRPDKQAIGFVAGFLAALGSAVAGRLLRSVLDRRGGAGDD